MRPLALSLLLGLALAAPALAQDGNGELFDCVATPARTVKLGSPVTGLLADVKVRRGDVVEAGQPVARLESSVEEAKQRMAKLAQRATVVAATNA